jgi:4-aminobutyrate aminotransferase/(S)-3-amino-2-methylpropionate transaminase
MGFIFIFFSFDMILQTIIRGGQAMIKQGLAEIVTGELPGPQSRELGKKRESYVARGISNSTGIFIAAADGALVKDVDGNTFIDFAAGIGVQNIGHCNPNVVRAIQKQADQYIHPCFNVEMYESYLELAAELARLTPGRFLKKAMFANSGAEAVENSIKIARRYTGKTGILSLENAFHGRTYMAMTLTSKVKPYKNGFGPFCPDSYKIPSPYCYRCPLGASYPGCGLACVEKLRFLLKGELDGDQIAVLIAEPVQGEGGFIVTPPGYLTALREICTDYGIVFVLDEVQSGFARTGKLFAAEHYQVEPDLITLSKSLAAGVPLSAVVGKAAIMDAPNPGEIGGTYGGSPLGTVAALEVLKFIEEADLPAKANRIGEIIISRLEAMKGRYDSIGDVRGLGAMCAVELVKDRQTKEPNPQLVKDVIAYALQKGVILISAGMLGNVIRFLPPLVATPEQVEYVMTVVDEAITKCSH